MGTVSGDGGNNTFACASIPNILKNNKHNALHCVKKLEKMWFSGLFFLLPLYGVKVSGV